MVKKDGVGESEKMGNNRKWEEDERKIVYRK